MKRILLLTTLFVSSSYAHNFDNTLLIINYNHPHYESIPLLRSIYGTTFKNIVFYGPEKHADVHFYAHHKGYFSYLCIADAMQRYPHFDGYLFLMDDCILNTWMLTNMDLTKVWYPKIRFIRNTRGHAISLRHGSKNFKDWSWWETQWGHDAMLKSFIKIPLPYKKVLAHNWGRSRVVCAFSDIIYIPAHYKNLFVFLAEIFGDNQAFLETALPTITSCLCPKTEWVLLPGNSTYTHGAQDFRTDVYFNHPIKLSYPANQQFISDIFAKQENQCN
jgi:hypothetical protein